MKLTPLDIRHKEFKRGMRGYADTEVDEFLDEVADEFERLFKENIDVSERLEALEEKIAHYRMIEDTLQKTLLSAQQSAEELKQNATKESQLILRDAELKARQIVNESYADKQRIEQEVTVLKNAEEEFRFRFRNTLEGYLKQVGDFGQSTGQRMSDFQRQADALKEAIAREETVLTAPPAPAPAAPVRPSAAPAPPPPARAAEPEPPAPPPPAPEVGLREALRQAQAAGVHDEEEAEPEPAEEESPADEAPPVEPAIAPRESVTVAESLELLLQDEEPAAEPEAEVVEEAPAEGEAAGVDTPAVEEAQDVPPDLAPPANTGVSRRVPVEWRVSADEPAGGTGDAADAGEEAEEDDFKW
jgi:cell division initiation protein